MPSTRPEDFLSTVRTTAARPGQVLDVVVLTSDVGLLAALRTAAGSEHALWDAPSADSAVDHLVGGRCDILIADLGSLRGDVVALLERLQAQFPELILMASGRREEEGAVAALLSSGRIYRFLHKPVSPGRANQFLNAATRRYNELRDVTPTALSTVRTLARTRPYLGKVFAGVGCLLAAAIAFAVWQSRDQGLPATMQPLQVGDAPVEDRIQSKLGSAQIAYLSGRLIDPRGDNALEYYKAVLAMEPANTVAQTGVQKVIDTLERRVTQALQERSAPRVVTAWTALQRAAPDHPRLDALRAQLLALSRTMPKTPQAAVANNARPTATRESKANISAARDADVFSSSADSSTEVSQLEADAAERELAAAIARELSEQEAAATAAPVERDATAPAQSEPPPTQQVAAVANPPPGNALDAVEQSGAVQPEDGSSKNTVQVAQAASLKRVREVPPVYPKDAARTGIEGWVQVEFTIAPDGTTQDLEVLDSAPAAVFDRAALDSVRKWRFEPVRSNGAPVAQRAVLQLKFVLND